jgi:hypothetical protein
MMGQPPKATWRATWVTSGQRIEKGEGEDSSNQVRLRTLSAIATEVNPNDRKTRGDRGRASHGAVDDRRTFNAIFHHPAPHNLSWMDVLRLLKHLGSADERADGKYSVTINGNHLVLHKPHGKHLDASQVADLRHYFASSGISPDNPYGTPAKAASSSADVVVLIDHHGAKLYQIHLSSDQQAKTVTPYDPHHFLHHLHHRDEASEQGQPPAKDLTFYDRIAETLRDVDRVVLVSHGTGASNASNVLAEQLKKHHPGIYKRIVRREDVNTSAMTEAQILAYGRQVLATYGQGPL